MIDRQRRRARWHRPAYRTFPSAYVQGRRPLAYDEGGGIPPPPAVPPPRGPLTESPFN